MPTDFSNQCNILGELYANYKENEDLEDFIEFNDLGLPLAYLARENLCEVTSDGAKYIAETFELFLETLEIKDSGFENLTEVMQASLNPEQ